MEDPLKIYNDVLKIIGESYASEYSIKEEFEEDGLDDEVNCKYCGTSKNWNTANKPNDGSCQYCGAKKAYEVYAVEGVDDLTSDDVRVLSVLDDGQIPLGYDDSIINKLVRLGYAQDIGKNDFGQKQAIITKSGHDWLKGNLQGYSSRRLSYD